VIVIPTLVAWGAMAAAVVLAASAWYALRPDAVTSDPIAEQSAPEQNPQAEPAEPAVVPAPVVATLSATHEAQWQIDPQASEPRVPQVGDALTAGQRLILTAGHARLTTAHGAVAILEGPCTIELTDSPNAIGLIQGKLVGIVETEQAKGFVVSTAQMTVVDLGTRFGVSCSAQGTHVRVLEGKVQAAPVADDSAKHTVVAGQSVAAADGARWVSVLAEPGEDFVMDWQAVAAVPELTGDIRYEPAMPSDLRLGRYTDAKILLFHERTAVDLRSPITVNNYVPGRFVNEQLLETTQIAPTVVDSYLIHLDTPNIARAGSARTATITFDRPVLGIIGSSGALAQSHDILGQPGVRYGSMSAGDAGRFSGLDQSEKQPEIIEISEDRKTLTLHLSALEGMDQARILVASQSQPE
jgi:hypothetical protein